MTAILTRPRTGCRTAADAFDAGWADGADDAPLTQQQIDALVALHAPHVDTG